MKRIPTVCPDLFARLLWLVVFAPDVFFFFFFSPGSTFCLFLFLWGKLATIEDPKTVQRSRLRKTPYTIQATAIKALMSNTKQWQHFACSFNETGDMMP